MNRLQRSQSSVRSRIKVDAMWFQPTNRGIVHVALTKTPEIGLKQI